MHRGYFARSLEENKEDPLSGKYGPSVLAAVCSFLGLPGFGLTLNHAALYSLFFHQPHQEPPFATAYDGGTDVVLPHPCLLLFGSCLLLLLPENMALTLKLLADRPWSDCNEVSWYGVISISIVQPRVVLCAV